MKVLVAGGAGYIGSVVTDQLLGARYDVTVLDNFSKGHRKAVADSRIRLVEGDLSDIALLRRTLTENNIQAVLQFAAFIDVGESMREPEKYFRNNTLNTLTLLEAMCDVGVGKFVFSSTAAVYGIPERFPITEDMPLKPVNPYGDSKLRVEQKLPGFNLAHGMHYAVLRYFNACGATEKLGEDHQPEGHLIPLAIDAVLGRRKPLQLFGTDYPTKDGTCVRDYIHVSDLATAHLLALEALEEKDSQVYNLGNQRGYSNREVLEAVGRVAGKPVPYTEAARREGDPPVLVASSDKIRRELGWRPQFTDPDAIIGSAFRWRTDHPEGYRE